MNKKLKYIFLSTILFPLGFMSCNNNENNNLIDPVQTIKINKDKADSDLEVILNNLDIIQANHLLRNYHKKHKSFYENLKKVYDENPIIKNSNINKIDGEVKSTINDIKWKRQKLTFKIETEFVRAGVKYKILQEAFQAPLEIIKINKDQFIIAVKVTTTQTNSRLSDLYNPTKMLVRENYVSVREIFGSWIDQLANINKDQNDHIVKNIKLLYTNNENGNITFDNTNQNKKIGLLKIAAFIKKARPDLLISSGKFIENQKFQEHDHSKNLMNSASLIGYDLMTVGSDNFKYGYKTLVGRAKTTPLYSNNIFYGKRKNIKSFNTIKGKLNEPYDIIAKPKELLLPGIKNKLIKGNLQVGIIALTNPKVKNKVHPSNINDINFDWLTLNTQKEIDNLRKSGSKLIIIVVHNENKNASFENTKKIMSKLNGVNLIVDGHSKSVYSNKELFNKNAKSNSSNDHNVEVITFDFDTKNQKILNIRNDYIDYDELINLDNQALSY